MTCSTTIDTLSFLDRKGRKECQFLLVTLDPKSDSVEVLHALRRQDHLSKRVTLLRGSELMTQQLAKSLGFAYRRDGTGIAHQSGIVLIDARGNVCKSFSGTRPNVEKFQKAVLAAR